MICQEALFYIKTCHLSKLRTKFFFLSQNQTCLRDSDSDSDVAGSLKRQREDEHDHVLHCEQDELQIKNGEVALQK